MTHIATIFFFALALVGAGSLIQWMVIDYRGRIIAALRYGNGGGGRIRSDRRAPAMPLARQRRAVL